MLGYIMMGLYGCRSADINIGRRFRWANIIGRILKNGKGRQRVRGDVMMEARSERYNMRSPPAIACFEGGQRDHKSRNAGGPK